jgi:precorrin-2 methylase
VIKIVNSLKVADIVNFVTKHPQSTVGRRICREILGEAVDRFNEEFAMELEAGLRENDEARINAYYSLVR